MSAAVSAESMVRALVSALRAPDVRVLDLKDDLRDEVSGLGVGALVVWVVKDRDDAELLAIGAGLCEVIDDVQVGAVAEGWLVAAVVGPAEAQEPDTVPEASPLRPAVPEPPSPPNPSGDNRRSIAPSQQAASAAPEQPACRRRRPATRPSSSTPKARNADKDPFRGNPQPSDRPSPVPERHGVPGATLAELDRELLARTFGPDRTRWLRELEQIGAVNGGVPTLAGLAVFGRRPQVFVLGMSVVVSASDEARAFAGPVPRLIADVLGWAPAQRVDPRVIRGLLVEAFARRDWSTESAIHPVALDLGDATVEVRFPAGSHVEPRPLAAMLARVGLDPVAMLGDVSRALAPQRLRNTTGDGVTHIIARVPAPSEPGRLPRVERRRCVLAFLEQRGPSSTAELIAGLGWTRSTVRAVLAELFADGEVRPLAGGLQAPGQRYAIARP